MSERSFAIDEGSPVDVYNALFPDEKSKADAFDKLAKNYYRANFGTMQKSEIDLLMFSEYLDRLYDFSEYIGLDYSDYTLSNLLGLTPSRVNSLKCRKEIKYHSNFKWKEVFRHEISKAEYKDNKVYIFIRDPRLYLVLCAEIEKLGSYSEATLTKQLLVVSPPVFIDLMMLTYDKDSPEKEKLREKLKEILEENSFNGDAYFRDGSLGATLKRAADKSIANVLFSFIHQVPYFGEGLYTCGKDVLEEIKKSCEAKKEQNKQDKK